MKKSFLSSKIVLGALAIATVAVVLVSNTYARYTTSVSKTDTIAVAKWDIKYKNGTEGELEVLDNSITFDLFATVKDTNGAEENNVVAERIAPGTSGAFTFRLQNLSEVTAQYTLSIAKTSGDNLPIQYSIDNGTTWVSAAETADNFHGVLDIGSDAITKTVQWRWAFDATTIYPTATVEEINTYNTSDSGFGATPANYTITATLTVDQVD